MLFCSKVALKLCSKLCVILKLTWYVVVILVNNLVFNISDRRFDCKLADFRCECNTIMILTNRIQEINKNGLIEITFF